jgi:hypothetical protein
VPHQSRQVDGNEGSKLDYQILDRVHEAFGLAFWLHFVNLLDSQQDYCIFQAVGTISKVSMSKVHFIPLWTSQQPADTALFCLGCWIVPLHPLSTIHTTGKQYSPEYRG